VKILRWCAPVLVALAIVWMADASPALAQADAPDISDVQIDGEYGQFPTYMPPDVSKHGYHVDDLINILHVFMILLFVGWGIFFVWCLMKFRARPGHTADYKLVKAKAPKYLEVAVALFEAFLLVGLSMPVWARVKDELPTEADNPIHVRVVAEQFAWNFHYPGKDGLFGRVAPEFLNSATNVLGLDPSDPNGNDDFVSGEMHLPVDRPVITQITSKDVIHSFAIPVMRVKQDAVPGMRISVWFHPVKTGTYEIACAQLCGNNHYSMRAILKLESQSDYDAWFEEMAKGPAEFDEDDL